MDQNVSGLSPAPWRVPPQVPKHLFLQEEKQKQNGAARLGCELCSHFRLHSVETGCCVRLFNPTLLAGVRKHGLGNVDGRIP